MEVVPRDLIDYLFSFTKIESSLDKLSSLINESFLTMLIFN